MSLFKNVLFVLCCLTLPIACSDVSSPITETDAGADSAADIPSIDVPIQTTDIVADDTFHCKNNSQCDDNNPCTTDICDFTAGVANAACVNDANPNVACDDGNACTTGDACDVTKNCVGQPLDCNDKNPCTHDNCTVATGCVHSDADGVKCDDNDVCTDNDTCAKALCVGATITCDDGLKCTDDTCDKTTGCKHANKVDTPCSDLSACTENDHCSGGLCVGTKVNMSDNNPCTFDACDPVTGISHVASVNGIVCQDGNACTIGDHCVNAACVPGSTVDCKDGNVCAVGTCNTGTGVCEFKYSGEVFCNDNNFCTENDHCANIDCVGTPSVCNDGNECTSDSCLQKTGCYFPAKDQAPCTDGNACTQGDHCSQTNCIGGAANACEDNNVCTNDSCNPSNGICSHWAVQGGPCDDGNACTLADSCSDTTCSGTQKKCTDNNPCTDNTCNKQTGCYFVTQDSIACNDGNACAVSQLCFQGVCKIAVGVNCDDGLKCTLDSCDKTTGCVHAPIVGCTP